MTKFNGPTLRAFKCPECHKLRLYRSSDHVVSTETKTVNDITHFIDVCEFCLKKIYERLYVPSKKNLKKMLKELHDPNKSLEDLL